MVVRFPQRQKVYLFSKTQEPALAPAHPPVQRAIAVLSPGVRAADAPSDAAVKNERITSLSHTSL